MSPPSHPKLLFFAQSIIYQRNQKKDFYLHFLPQLRTYIKYPTSCTLSICKVPFLIAYIDSTTSTVLKAQQAPQDP